MRERIDELRLMAGVESQSGNLPFTWDLTLNGHNKQRWIIYAISVKVTTTSTVGSRNIILYLRPVSTSTPELVLKSGIVSESDTLYITYSGKVFMNSRIVVAVKDLNGVDANDAVEVVLLAKRWQGEYA